MTENYTGARRFWFFRSVARITWFCILSVLAIVWLILATCSFYHIDTFELGYQFDRYEGKIERLHRKGWIWKPVWHYGVHTVDLRPAQVQMNANSRVLNAKLVQFNPEGLDTFIAWHGRDAGDNTTQLHEILKSYAFNVNNGADCPFLTILDEMQPRTLKGVGKSESQSP